MQKETARNAREDGSSWDGDEAYVFENAKPTVFTGYDALEAEAKITGIVVEGEGVSQAICTEQNGFIVTDITPFYAEMGGQTGDTGIVSVNGKAAADIVNTTKTADGYYMHEIHVCCGMITAYRHSARFINCKRNCVTHT